MFALKYYVIVLNEGEQLLKKRENGCSFTTSQTALGIKFAPFEDDLERDPWFRTTVDNLFKWLQIIKQEHRSFMLYKSKKM